MTHNGLTHLNEAGEATMVDVSGKEVTTRTARAQARLRMSAETLSAIQSQSVAKGEVLAVARVAGIQGAKRCSDLIPLCHPLPLSKVTVDFAAEDDCRLVIEAECKVAGKTGVEMEALTAVSVAALTVYDMCKAIDKSMVIEHTCLLTKHGGKSGAFAHPEMSSKIAGQE